MRDERRRRDASPLAGVPQPDDVPAATAAALRILNGAAQSGYALTRRLVGRGFSAETAAEAVAEMRRYGYVDDAALATSIAGRRRRAGYGAARIEADLRSRGISGNEINAALASAGDGNDVEGAHGVAQRAWRLGDDATDDERTHERRRIARLLQRRGFGSDAISSALRDLGR